MSFSESLAPLPSTMSNRPVAFGSRVPQWPTFLMPKRRRMRSTTSCEVRPAGLSTRMPPSSEENSIRAIGWKSVFEVSLLASPAGKSLRAAQRLLHFGEHAALDAHWPAGHARTGGRGMAAAAENFRHGVDVHLLALGTEADAGERGINLLEQDRDDHRIDCADVVDQSLAVVRQCAGAGEVFLLEPEVGDAVVVGQMKTVID